LWKDCTEATVAGLSQTKFNRHCQRIEQGIMNIAKELRDTLDEKVRREKLIGEMKFSIHENAQKVQSLPLLKADTILVKHEIAEEIQNEFFPQLNVRLQYCHVYLGIH
jgi:hypothetical protein